MTDLMTLFFDIENSLYLFYFCISMILRYYYYFGIFYINTFIYFSERNGIIRFFSKPLYQPNSNAVSVIPFENGKFKPDDTKTFFIGMVGMVKSKKDNVLKQNGISGPGQYRI